MEDGLIHIDVQKTILSANGKVSLDINTVTGSCGLVALFGVSGAGKTTLLRMLAGLTSPDKGQIKFGNTVWFDSERKVNVPPQKRNISFMFQDYALFPNMTVEKNIRFAQTESDLKEVDRLIELFGLNEFRKRKPQSLSGGQKQRVALARALARKPQLLLLDEPLSALDAEMRNALQEEIGKIHKMLGIATILVSHDLNEVFKLASHVIHLENGKVKCTGNPEEVFSENRISGKMQVTGQIARIDEQDNFSIVTVIINGSQVLKVIAFDDDIKRLNVGDRVIVFTKAFNPIICKLE